MGRSLGFEMGINELLPRERLWIIEDDMGITLTMVAEPRPCLALLDWIQHCPMGLLISVAGICWESSNCQDSDLSFGAEYSWERFWDLLLLVICLSQFTLKTQSSVHQLHWH